MPTVDGASVYGGTPADASVIEAIRTMRTAGKDVMFYPFILMDQIDGNSLPDPWTGAASQPVLPWRGRITLAEAPGRAGSTDRTSGAVAEVTDFFGLAERAHFAVSGETISYSGPADWGFRRFILHYAHLCAVAGGVESFCIGSEMRSLTQVRGLGDSFPAVAELQHGPAPSVISLLDLESQHLRVKIHRARQLRDRQHGGYFVHFHNIVPGWR